MNTKRTLPAWIWLAGALAAFLWFVASLRSLAAMLLVAWFLAYVLDPLADLLERRRVPRAASAVLILALACIAFALGTFLVVPALTDQLRSVAQALPSYAEQARQEFVPQLEQWLGRPLPTDLPALLSQAASELQGALPGLARGAAVFSARLFTNIWALVQGILSALLVPVFAFYLLLDFNGLGERLVGLLPLPAQPAGRQLLERCDEVLGAFVRGQLAVCAALAVVYSVGLTFTGIDMPWVVGLLSGALFIVPYLGTAVGVVLGSLLALLKFHDLPHLLGVWAVFAVGQGLEGFVLTPRMVGDRVGLHPLAVILAVLAGGGLFGFTGVLLAVPAAAVIRVGLDEALAAYRRSALYRGEDG